ncbi:MAG: hypothetical protein Q9165_001008 [Trypethelium subeluteriae]
MSIHQRDPTFIAFTSEQAKHYANTRPSYPAELFQYVFDHHATKGGSFQKLLDVGCGPGKATRDMLPVFEEVIGIDAGPEMIETARGLGGTTKSGKEVRYEVSRAEEIDKVAGLQEGTVDMITGATCAVDKTADPTQPRCDIITERMKEFEGDYQGSHVLRGNEIVHNQYRDLELPWEIDTPVVAFPREKYLRKEWDYDNDFEDRDDFLGGSRNITIKQIEGLIDTTSSMIRWREAHPDLVGTDEDYSIKMMKKLREAAGMAPNENGTLRVGAPTTLLLFQKA